MDTSASAHCQIVQLPHGSQWNFIHRTSYTGGFFLAKSCLQTEGFSSKERNTKCKDLCFVCISHFILEFVFSSDCFEFYFLCFHISFTCECTCILLLCPAPCSHVRLSCLPLCTSSHVTCLFCLPWLSSLCFLDLVGLNIACAVCSTWTAVLWIKDMAFRTLYSCLIHYKNHYTKSLQKMFIKFHVN